MCGNGLLKQASGYDAYAFLLLTSCFMSHSQSISYAFILLHVSPSYHQLPIWSLVSSYVLLRNLLFLLRNVCVLLSGIQILSVCCPVCSSERGGHGDQGLSWLLVLCGADAICIRCAHLLHHDGGCSDVRRACQRCGPRCAQRAGLGILPMWSQAPSVGSGRARAPRCSCPSTRWHRTMVLLH